MKRFVFSLVVLGITAYATGQNPKQSYIGYVYPAGGQRGTSFEVLVGGQFLAGSRRVYFSGEGLRGQVIEHYRPIRNLSREQRLEIQNRLSCSIQTRWKEAYEAGLVSQPSPPWQQGPGRNRPMPSTGPIQNGPVELPAHPSWRNWEEKSLRELLHIREESLNAAKKQPNDQIGEMVLLAIQIDPNTEPGDRELRMETLLGLTNPISFQVGTLPEIKELEPNDPLIRHPLPDPDPHALPLVFNGQIMPGDVDRFQWYARQGQRLVLQVHARSLLPFMADAVPGWFQPTLSLFNEAGKEIAFADDFHHHPDPVIFCTIPKTGIYELEIRDAMYRGRQDFVYRISVSESPSSPESHPLLTDATLCPSGDLREVMEDDSNDTLEEAQRTDIPCLIIGRIDPPGDVDTFQFEAKAGTSLVMEVSARRLGSPIDSLVRFLDDSGTILSWNDDPTDRDGYLHRDLGILTHSADSYLRISVPSDGIYFAQISDVRSHGSPLHAYRLHIRHPRPDFALISTPSSLTLRTGLAAAIEVHVIKKDGFDNDIDVSLVNPPAGMALQGGKIPAGKRQAWMTLTAPWPQEETFCLQLEGTALIDGQVVKRPSFVADRRMQAFLYEHLAPAQELRVVSRKGAMEFKSTLSEENPIKIPRGGSERVSFPFETHRKIEKVELQLHQGSEGIKIHSVTKALDELFFHLEATSSLEEAQAVEYLIVEVYGQMQVRARGKVTNKGARRLIYLGALPAIPYQIVRKGSVLSRAHEIAQYRNHEQGKNGRDDDTAHAAQPDSDTHFASQSTAQGQRSHPQKSRHGDH